MFADANNTQKFILIDGIAIKIIISEYYWFISEYYCLKTTE